MVIIAVTMVTAVAYVAKVRYGEPGYTNDIKSCMSPDEYVMTRLLRPEKLGFEYMTA